MIRASRPIEGLKFRGASADPSTVMTVTGLDTLTLVPPMRLGRLLVERRRTRGLDLVTLARRTGGRYDATVLTAIEAGRLALGDEDLGHVSDLYGLRAEPAVRPRRTRLAIDVEDAVTDEHVHLTHRTGSDPDEVLIRYLGLIVALRAAVPGHPVMLRVEDLIVLADALWLEPDEVEARLTVLMTNPRNRLGRRAQRLSRRTVIPAAGILVAATEEGLLVLDPQPQGPGPGMAVGPDHRGTTVIALARRDVPTVGVFAARSA